MHHDRGVTYGRVLRLDILAIRGEVQDDEEPEECEQDELRENMMRDHGVAPSNMS